MVRNWPSSTLRSSRAPKPRWAFEGAQQKVSATSKKMELRERLQELRTSVVKRQP
jgi:hypothetical protein